LREHIRRSTPKFQSRLSRYRLNVRDTPHAVRAKNLFLLGHGVIETLER
jgi:hypothetical protein